MRTRPSTVERHAGDALAQVGGRIPVSTTNNNVERPTLTRRRSWRGVKCATTLTPASASPLPPISDSLPVPGVGVGADDATIGGTFQNLGKGRRNEPARARGIVERHAGESEIERTGEERQRHREREKERKIERMCGMGSENAAVENGRFVDCERPNTWLRVT